MRKIEEEMVTAIKEARPYKKDNTEVTYDLGNNQVVIRLHGNLIAYIDNDVFNLYLSDAGYRTKTTKSRLNAILSLYDLGKIYSKSRKWYLKTDDEEEEWKGSKTFYLETEYKGLVTIVKA